MVWLIPLVALAIGGWLAYKTLSEQGPTVEIRFKTAAGLEAGKTKVKFKDVDIGQVAAIDVNPDLKTVTVTAQLKYGSFDYLTENTRFWVERPRVTASRVSGLETLLSGAYIAMDPVTEGRPARYFEGLDEPPLFTTSEPGKRFVLRSATLGSLNIGSPVYYRQIQVGQVVGYELGDDGGAVSIELFVSAPHDALVFSDTRFWNASGVDFSLSASGFRVDTQSLLSVLIGGISFDTPDTIEGGRRPAEPGEVFPLYPSRDEAHEKIYQRKDRYLLFFKGSVRGLSVGAPVLLRGISVGHVLDVQLTFSIDDFEFHIPVLIELEPDRVGIRGGGSKSVGLDVMERLVERGLRGQLKSASLLTGQLYVDLDFHPDARPEMIARHGDYKVLPTVPAPLEALTTQATEALDQVRSILGKVDALPIEGIGREARETLAGANTVVNSAELKGTIKEAQSSLMEVRKTAETLNAVIAPELDTTLRQTTETMKYAGDIVAANSPFYIEMSRMFQELSAAARSVRIMAEYLERHPEALIKGKGAGR
ncbi:MAG: mammalian cell entry protein [Chromatiaceae bacterium]|nr:mammalian cell entry protein [Chromatiaceae bacterium]